MSSAFGTGAVIGGYRIVSPIGEGAMGSVYLAEGATPEERVALKLLAPELARDERFRRRFLRESEIAGSIRHPCAVRVLDSGEDDGRLYLAMTYIEGRDLRELLSVEGRLEPARAVALIADVAGALDAAHGLGLVHRDVKPGNVLVSSCPERERAYVCDFGVARHVSSVGSLTGERGFVGTVDYVSPEQIEGGTLDGRVDVYSLGCVLFECLTGERPYERESELAVVFAHLNEPPPRLTEFRPELPRAFDDVFATALAKEPEERYPTCGEMVAAARAALEGKTLVRRKRSRRLVGALVLLAAAGGVVGGIVLTDGGGGARAAAAISPISIDGARLGLKAADYKRMFGTPYRDAVLSPEGLNYPARIFLDRKLSVYFKHPGGRAALITTWNKAFETEAGIGPCSTVAQLKAAYGSALEPSHWNTQGTKVYAYVLGKHLLFAADDLEHVTAIALYHGDELGADQPGGAWPIAGYVATSETPCT